MPTANGTAADQSAAYGAAAIVFEAFPENLSTMKRTLREIEATDCVTTFNRAVWSKDNLMLEFSDNFVDYGSRTQINGQVFNMGVADASVAKAVHRVQSITLDSVIHAPIHLLKVDAEGSEWHIFNGARKLLAAGHPRYIMFEFSPINIHGVSQNPNAGG